MTTAAGGSNGTGGTGASGSDATTTPVPAGNRSGTRLVWKPRQTSYGVSLGGLQPVYFASSFWGERYDSLKGRACEFVATPDGRTRCMPPGQTFYSEGFFLDSECKRPLAMVQKVEYTIPNYGRPPCPDGFMKEAKTGSDTFAVHPIGPSLTPPTVYSLSRFQVCGGRAPPALYEFFEVLPELTYSEWVSAVEQIGDGTTRLRGQYLVGEDGARELINWYDTRRGEPCRFEIAADSRYRCLPQLVRAALTDARPDLVTAPTTVGYADAKCTVEVCQGGLCDDPKVEYIGRKRDSCDSNLRIHSRGAVAIATHERSAADPTCHTIAPSQGIALGPEIPAESFESAEVVDEAPTGRLQRKLLVTRDGVTEPLGLYDTVRQESCDLAPSDDGTWRCLPLHHQAGVSYSDAACTTPIALVWVSPEMRCSTEAALPRYAIDTDQSGCPTRNLVYQIGEKVDPPVLYHHGFGRACTASAPLTANASAYALAKRSPDDFELVTLRP